VSDIDIAVADSLKVLDLKRPIREATEIARRCNMSRRASYGLMRRSKERRSLKSPMRFLRDLGIWRTSLSERNILRIAS
jgi:hypothetical protein